MSAAWFAQEYLCEFTDDSAGWFNRGLVEEALSGEERHWLNVFDWRGSLLEQKRLRIARRMRKTGMLVRELVNVRVLRRTSGGLRVGADGTGEHDDLALAVALALWSGRNGKSGEQGGKRLL
jgi:hypothetical protein